MCEPSSPSFSTPSRHSPLSPLSPASSSSNDSDSLSFLLSQEEKDVLTPSLAKLARFHSSHPLIKLISRLSRRTLKELQLKDSKDEQDAAVDLDVEPEVLLECIAYSKLQTVADPRVKVITHLCRKSLAEKQQQQQQHVPKKQASDEQIETMPSSQYVEETDAEVEKAITRVFFDEVAQHHHDKVKKLDPSTYISQLHEQLWHEPILLVSDSIFDEPSGSSSSNAASNSASTVDPNSDEVSGSSFTHLPPRKSERKKKQPMHYGDGFSTYSHGYSRSSRRTRAKRDEDDALVDADPDANNDNCEEERDAGVESDSGAGDITRPRRAKKRKQEVDSDRNDAADVDDADAPDDDTKCDTSKITAAAPDSDDESDTDVESDQEQPAKKKLRVAQVEEQPKKTKKQMLTKQELVSLFLAARETIAANEEDVTEELDVVFGLVVDAAKPGSSAELFLYNPEMAPEQQKDRRRNQLISIQRLLLAQKHRIRNVSFFAFGRLWKEETDYLEQLNKEAKKKNKKAKKIGFEAHVNSLGFTHITAKKSRQFYNTIVKCTEGHDDRVRHMVLAAHIPYKHWLEHGYLYSEIDKEEQKPGFKLLKEAVTEAAAKIFKAEEVEKKGADDVVEVEIGDQATHSSAETEPEINAAQNNDINAAETTTAVSPRKSPAASSSALSCTSSSTSSSIPAHLLAYRSGAGDGQDLAYHDEKLGQVIDLKDRKRSKSATPDKPPSTRKGTPAKAAAEEDESTSLAAVQEECHPALIRFDDEKGCLNQNDILLAYEYYVKPEINRWSTKITFYHSEPVDSNVALKFIKKEGFEEKCGTNQITFIFLLEAGHYRLLIIDTSVTCRGGKNKLFYLLDSRETSIKDDYQLDQGAQSLVEHLQDERKFKWMKQLMFVQPLNDTWSCGIWMLEIARIYVVSNVQYFWTEPIPFPMIGFEQVSCKDDGDENDEAAVLARSKRSEENRNAARVLREDIQKTLSTAIRKKKEWDPLKFKEPRYETKSKSKNSVNQDSLDESALSRFGGRSKIMSLPRKPMQKVVSLLL